MIYGYFTAPAMNIRSVSKVDVKPELGDRPSAMSYQKKKSCLYKLLDFFYITVY